MKTYTKMRIKVISDIHLEFQPADYPELKDDDIDIICLCGDIGNPAQESYKRFLLHCADKSRIHTLVIAGNHEYYGHTVAAAQDLIADICSKHDKLTFLNNSSYRVAEHQVTFLGTTLWSDIDSQSAWQIRNSLSDFHRIKGWGIGESKEAFYSSYKWLRAEMDLVEDSDKVVVLTHHCPLMDVGNPIYSDSPLQSSFESDLSDFIDKNTDKIAYWFYGHNHYSNDTIIGTTHVISNQVGYADNKDSDSRYNPDLVIHV